MWTAVYIFYQYILNVPFEYIPSTPQMTFQCLSHSNPIQHKIFFLYIYVFVRQRQNPLNKKAPALRTKYCVFQSAMDNDVWTPERNLKYPHFVKGRLIISLHALQTCQFKCCLGRQVARTSQLLYLFIYFFIFLIEYWPSKNWFLESQNFWYWLHLNMY